MKMSKKPRAFASPEIAAIFESYPGKIRTNLLFLRGLLYDVATNTQGVGPLKETLKWGQPSYHPVNANIGTTIRLDQTATDTDAYALYFHCQTTLVDTFREMYPSEFTYQGNRAIIFNTNTKIRVPALKDCIALALTYHLRKKQH